MGMLGLYGAAAAVGSKRAALLATVRWADGHARLLSSAAARGHGGQHLGAGQQGQETSIPPRPQGELEGSNVSAIMPPPFSQQHDSYLVGHTLCSTLCPTRGGGMCPQAALLTSPPPDLSPSAQLHDDPRASSAGPRTRGGGPGAYGLGQAGEGSLRCLTRRLDMRAHPSAVYHCVPSPPLAAAPCRARVPCAPVRDAAHHERR